MAHRPHQDPGQEGGAVESGRRELLWEPPPQSPLLGPGPADSSRDLAYAIGAGEPEILHDHAGASRARAGPRASRGLGSRRRRDADADPRTLAVDRHDSVTLGAATPAGRGGSAAAGGARTFLASSSPMRRTRLMAWSG